jgi:hypothetical protein
MSSASYFNPAFENQYLENDQFDMEGDFEDLEYENLEGSDPEGYSLEDELSYEDGEDGEMGELEGDQFSFGRIFRKITPVLKMFAPKVASLVGGAVGGPAGAAIANRIASAVAREQEEMEYSGEYLGEEETQFESMLEASGLNMEILGEMAHYAELAAQTENEAEADQFIGAIANLASQILPNLLGESQYEDISRESIVSEAIYEDEADQFLPLIAAAAPLIGKAAGALLPRVLPHAARAVSRAVQGVGRSIKRMPPAQRRVAMRALPRVAAKTALRTARALPKVAATSKGRPTAQSVGQVVAGAAARPIVETLGSPTTLQTAARRNRMWARQYRVSGTLTMTPIRRRRM